jgi:hypothetical protein
MVPPLGVLAARVCWCAPLIFGLSGPWSEQIIQAQNLWMWMRKFDGLLAWLSGSTHCSPLLTSLRQTGCPRRRAAFRLPLLSKRGGILSTISITSDDESGANTWKGVQSPNVLHSEQPLRAGSTFRTTCANMCAAQRRIKAGNGSSPRCTGDCTGLRTCILSA